MSDLTAKRLSMDEFTAIQAEILTQWPTGRDVDFDEAVAYHQSLPANKIFSRALDKAKTDGNTLIQLCAGVAQFRNMSNC